METADFDPQEVRRGLELVLSSSGFSRNERQSQFLRYLVERRLDGREADLKESLIAVEVFGRKPDYDPKLDAIVRTEAVRLRARLAKYYAEEGRSDSLVIDLPKGGYKPVFRRRPVDQPAPDARSGRHTPIAAAVAVLLLAVGAGAWWMRRDVAPITIAVLPLENVGRDAANDYFADGLTDEIIRNLSAIEGLTVRSRTSSFAFKGQRLTAADVGTALGVDYLLEGSVLQSGEQLRVNAVLVRVRDDYSVWSGRFDKRLTDIFSIQDEISLGIVNGLRLKLGRGRRQYETNLEAYDLYLRGRSAMAGFPVVGRQIAKGAIEYFDRAIQRDPNYALAYAGMADAFLDIDENVNYREAFPRAKAAAERAVALDPLLSEAQSALASVRAREYAWQEAEQGFRQAIELSPNNALAHLRLGLSVHVAQGRSAQGLREVREAVALDPLSPYANTELARALFLAGRYAEAVAQGRKAITLDQTRNRPYTLLARALYMDGKTDEALAVFEQAVKAGAVPRQGAPWFSCAAARAGRLDEARNALEQALDQGLPITRVLQDYVCLGDKEHAFESLQKKLAEREAGLPEMLLSPELAWMREDPRFAMLRKQVNLAP